MKATEQYFPVVLFYCAVQGSTGFWARGWNPKVDHSVKATEQYFSVVLFITLYKVGLGSESVDETVKHDYDCWV